MAYTLLYFLFPDNISNKKRALYRQIAQIFPNKELGTKECYIILPKSTKMEFNTCPKGAVL